MSVTMATILRHHARSGQLLGPVNIAKQQAISRSVKLLDMLLHAQQVMPPYGYFCDV